MSYEDIKEITPSMEKYFPPSIGGKLELDELK